MHQLHQHISGLFLHDSHYGEVISEIALNKQNSHTAPSVPIQNHNTSADFIREATPSG